VPYPGQGTGPRRWLNLVQGLLDTASGYLAAAQAPGLPSADAGVHVKEAEQLGDDCYKLLNFVVGADSTQIPRQAVAPFQRWVEALGITQTIFFRAEHLPNYELSWIDLRHLALLNDASKALVDAVASIRWPALRVSVPGHAMGLLPHFAVVGHELGHAIQESIKLDLPRHQTAIDEFLLRTQTRLQGDNHSFTPEDRIDALEILLRWLNELKADAVGHYLAGPAFFFALCGFLELSGQGYGIAPTHPPSDLRQRLLFNNLTDGTLSYATALHSSTGLHLTEDLNSPSIARCLPPDAMYSELKQRFSKTEAAVCVELLPAISSIADDVFHAARETLHALSPSLIYTPQQFASDLERHLEPLCHLIPPIEFNDGTSAKACTLTTILNVGWGALLARIDRFPPSRAMTGQDDTAARMETLHDLLLKAVELSEARQLWEEQT